MRIYFRCRISPQPSDRNPIPSLQVLNKVFTSHNNLEAARANNPRTDNLSTTVREKYGSPIPHQNSVRAVLDSVSAFTDSTLLVQVVTYETAANVSNTSTGPA
jgi:hypothetical protein